MTPHPRILIVTDTWAPEVNGVITALENLKRELEAKGCAVDVVEPSQFFSLPFPLYPEVRLALFARGAVRRKIRKGRYDIIHIATEGPLGWWASGACLSFGIPFTTAMHTQFHMYVARWVGKPVGKMVYAFMCRFHARAACTLVTTPAMQAQLRTAGLTRVRVWPPGIAAQFFTRGTCPAALQGPVFLFLGRVSSEKSVEEFLSADLPGTKLVVGDGPGRKSLEARFPDARFVGYQKGKALIDWCSCASVLVMPSRTETLGLVMMEALALGIPVAAHDVTGPREIVKDGVNGYLDEDIARAASRCLALRSEDCRASVAKYTWEASADAFLAIVSAPPVAE